MKDQLIVEFPDWPILSEPVSWCKGCGGTGVKTVVPAGHKQPCLCVCLSGSEDDRAGVVSLIGAAARRIQLR